MNEVIIKELIRIKINAARAIVDNLPPGMSQEIKDLGRIILRSVNEISQETERRPAKGTEPSDKVTGVPIE